MDAVRKGEHALWNFAVGKARLKAEHDRGRPARPGSRFRPDAGPGLRKPAIAILPCGPAGWNSTGPYLA